MLIGAHVSPAGGLYKSIERGTELDAESIQIFNQSPRMWRPTNYSEEDFARFRAARDQSAIGSVLIHAVYLLNCASEDPEIREKTLTSLTHSLRVGDEIGATGVVLHPGSAKTGHVGEAIARAGEVIAEALSESDRCALHLEDTAGAGGTLGRSFEELAALIEAAGSSERLGMCLDSCHLLASGYEIRTVEALDETLAECDRIVGSRATALDPPERLDDAARIQSRQACGARRGRDRRRRPGCFPLRATVCRPSRRPGNGHRRWCRRRCRYRLRPRSTQARAGDA